MDSRAVSHESDSDADESLSLRSSISSNEDDEFDHLFDIDGDEERDAACSQRMSLLVQIYRYDSADGQMSVARRDEFFSSLDDIRQSDYFLNLKSKHANNEKLTPREYFFFALTTDDVSALDANKLMACQMYYKHVNFENNLLILMLAHHWLAMDDVTKKAKYNEALRRELNKRGYVRTDLDIFLNLAGINLQGADLSMVSLDCVDLKGANLSGTNLYRTEIQYSRLDQANVAHACCVRPDAFENSGPVIRRSTALQACFDGVYAANLDWSSSDFTGASFKNATLGPAHFPNTKFDNANFDGGTLLFSGTYLTKNCSLQGAALSTAKINGAYYTQLNLTGAHLFPESTFENGINLINTIESACTNLIDPLRLRAPNDDSQYIRSEINARQKIIAENIIHHLRQRDLSIGDKIYMLEAIISHRIFEPVNTFQRVLARAESCIYAASYLLFNTAKHHREHFATDAVKLLEEERSALSRRALEL